MLFSCLAHVIFICTMLIGFENVCIRGKAIHLVQKAVNRVFAGGGGGFRGRDQLDRERERTGASRQGAAQARCGS